MQNHNEKLAVISLLQEGDSEHMAYTLKEGRRTPHLEKKRDSRRMRRMMLRGGSGKTNANGYPIGVFGKVLYTPFYRIKMVRKLRKKKRESKLLWPL